MAHRTRNLDRFLQYNTWHLIKNKDCIGILLYHVIFGLNRGKGPSMGVFETLNIISAGVLELYLQGDVRLWSPFSPSAGTTCLL